MAAMQTLKSRQNRRSQVALQARSQKSLAIRETQNRRHRCHATEPNQNVREAIATHELQAQTIETRKTASREVPSEKEDLRIDRIVIHLPVDADAQDPEAQSRSDEETRHLHAAIQTLRKARS